MGISKCPDCGEIVSTRAAACPHCGAPADASRAIESQPRPHESSAPETRSPIAQSCREQQSPGRNVLQQEWLPGGIAFVVAIPLFLGLYSEYYNSTTSHAFALVVVVSCLAFAWNIHSVVETRKFLDGPLLNLPNIVLISVFGFCVFGFGWTFADADPSVASNNKMMSTRVGTFFSVGFMLLMAWMYVGSFLTFVLRRIRWGEWDWPWRD